MNSLQFTAESSSNGMVERHFTVGGIPGVPGVLWSPASGVADRAPLVLMGHGGGAHKKHPAMAGRAQRLVTGCGFHVAVIDAPGHGDRPRTAQDEQDIAVLRRAQAAGEPEGPIIVPYNARLAELAVPEYKATLDALQELPEIGTDGPVGYVGIGLGTAIGLPLVAIEPRITAAVFGMHWPDALVEKAKQITVPIEFAMQWDNERIPREASLALFDAFASQEKTLHANAGKHLDMPRFEVDSSVRFFARHLGRALTSPA
ncbi:pimeloyl-ACP methyl ester carboxylesterase [Kitasatospora sp. MAP12-15]|uniref:alpha/beta hydrolase n=1 Tax=unclassified Kitasatospora TaxID=2633591 RepID=UPI002472F306|nr:alpha/beta hydrolase [Kitasatospora sp. MAP12-44]MDH6113933.1 pimeloyl-ACP methyl ester carboxylesterase [Kitasatospora sp. MAP12-44]